MCQRRSRRKGPPVGTENPGDRGYRFGLRDEASDARDGCDLYAPPAAPGDHACLGFLTDGERRLWTDYRSVEAAGATWTLRLDATRADQPFEVRFTPERPLPAGWQLRAIDTGTLHEVDLLKDGRLTGRVVVAVPADVAVAAGPVEYQDQARRGGDQKN
ncbi:MAG: hypothetical protein IPH48_15350 [bacterium]|nr:hypothetical protein [bacterium]